MVCVGVKPSRIIWIWLELHSWASNFQNFQLIGIYWGKNAPWWYRLTSKFKTSPILPIIFPTFPQPFDHWNLPHLPHRLRVGDQHACARHEPIFHLVQGEIPLKGPGFQGDFTLRKNGCYPVEPSGSWRTRRVTWLIKLRQFLSCVQASGWMYVDSSALLGFLQHPETA